MVINKRFDVLLLLMVLFSFGVKAQLTTSVRINEVLVINEENFMDDYGHRHPWFELYNNSAGTVDLGGCFLTDDKNNPKKYPIPKGDVHTKIAPYQHALFWADSEEQRGTFHVSFTFDPEKENYVALFDSDGKTLIDEVTIPVGQRADVSYGRSSDGTGEWVNFARVTPNANNITQNTNEKVENFQTNDSWGIGMTITAMAVVFCGLIVLYVLFKQIGNASIRASQRRAEKAVADRGGIVTANSGQASGEVLAAISMALYELGDDNHDIENTVLTIRKVQRRYSPWSSKIYGLRETPVLRK